jgi:hypothetical protein
MIMRSIIAFTCITLSAVLLLGCSMESKTDIGRSTRTLVRNGWTIHLDNIGTASVTDTDSGTHVTAGGHQIDINSDGVKLDGNSVDTGSSGNVNIANNNGKVTLAVNGQNVKVD